MNTNQRISQDHEADIQRRLGCRATRGSGNQFNNPMDGRHSAYSRTFAYAGDAKATRGESICVSRPTRRVTADGTVLPFAGHFGYRAR